jgi:hypothetical protein
MNRKTITPEFVYQTFKDLDIELQEDIESGSEDWMEIVSHLVSKDAYDDSTFTEDDHEYIMEFIGVLEEMGIELC